MGVVKKELVAGVLYIALAKYSGIVISLIVSAILARLLTPEDFGVVAIAMIFIVFFNIFSDLGIGAAIIQKKELTSEDVDHIFSFTIWLGIILGILFFSLAAWFAAWYDNAILKPVSQLLAFNLLFATFNVVPNALLQKEKRFKFIAYRTLSVQSVLGIFACFYAYYGGGIYALLINPIGASLGILVINCWQYNLHFHMKFHIKPLKLIFSYSVYQFLFSFINYFSGNIDKILIGKYLSMDQLGYYEKSYRLMLLPVQNITHVITPVIHPVFSNYQNDLSKLCFFNHKLIRLLGFIGFPLSVFLFFSAKELVLLVFGNQWLESVPVFAVFSLSVGWIVILTSCGAIFQASDSTKGLFYTGFINSIVNVLGYVIALVCFASTVACAWAYLITRVINFFVVYIYMNNKVFKSQFMPFFKELISPILLAFICIPFLFLVSHIQSSIPMIISLLIKFILWGAIILVYLYITKEYDLIKLVKN